MVRMFSRFILGAVIAVACTACEAPYKKKDAEDKQPLKNQAGDQNFQAFVGRLRIAVAKRDHATLAGMMTGDFGYRWDTPPPGESIFQYWDLHDLWPVLEGILREKFVPSDLYMVAPPQVVLDPNYSGYRAGIRTVGGSWKFAYFVPAEGAE